MAITPPRTRSITAEAISDPTSTPTDTDMFMKPADTTCDGSEPIDSTVISRNELKHANASALDRIRRRSNRSPSSQRNPASIPRQ